ncbi:recombinase family protein [Methylobacterium sp. JK268]
MQGSKRVTKMMHRRRKATPSGLVEDRPRVVGYVRVSTEGQFADGFGLDVQERAIRAFALSQGYDLVEIVSDCVSGATPPGDRKGFSRILELAAERAFGILLLYKFDRLARNVLHAVTSVHAMRDQFGVVIRSVTEPIDTASPMGEMIFTVLASMAAQERQVITERTFGGRKEKATKGGFAGGAVPYGYQRDKDGGLAVNEEQAEIVRRMFLERISGKTLAAVTDSLNVDGIPSPTGKRWSISSVAYLLDNPKYRGAVEYLFTWNGADTHVLREGQHDPILTSDFLQQAARLRPSAAASKRKPRAA